MGPAESIFVSCVETSITFKSERVRKRVIPIWKALFESYEVVYNLPMFGSRMREENRENPLLVYNGQSLVLLFCTLVPQGLSVASK